MDLNKIRQSETSKDYWKIQTMAWWRQYIKNVKQIKLLREQNRQLRKVNVTLKEVVNDYMEDESN